MTNTKDFKARNGKSYEIIADAEGTEISVVRGAEIIGTIELVYCEGVDHTEPDHYRITHLSLDGCPPRVGIGRACLEHHKECFGEAIIAGSDNGMKSSDGSHLTGSGPGFIRKMREEGLIDSDGSSRWDRYDDDE